MSEAKESSKVLFEWVRNKTGAGLLSLALLLVGAVAQLTREQLGEAGLLLALQVALGCLLLVLWSGVASTSRQQSKFSTLEKEIDRLKSAGSSSRNPPIVELPRRTDIEDKLMIFIIGAKGKTLPQIAAHLGMSEVRTEVVLSALAKDLFVYRQGYTEGPSYWCLGDVGKHYLTDADIAP